MLVAAPQMDPAEAARAVEMRARPFRYSPRRRSKRRPARAADAAPIAIDRVARGGVAAPPPPAALRLRDVRAHPDGVERDQRLGAVIALVGDELGRPVALGMHRFDLFGGFRAVSGSVAVSPAVASCTVTATIAPVSRSTPCSALCARCVRPSFIT